jgi:hypothetical protein
VPFGRTTWVAAYGLVAALFLGSVAQYYHPPFGFTAFITFSEDAHPYEIPAVQNVPHVDRPGTAAYDGMFYAQMATEPLIRDPAIDRALDNPPYRARRILFSWTAYALGLGRPDWILHVYAIQNVIAWLLTAWLLARWMPPASARNFVLWTGCLLSPGMLSSVRYALPDAPSALLVAAAVAIAERRRSPGGTPAPPGARQALGASLLVGLAALGRETSLLATTIVASFIRRDWRSWALTAGCGILCVLPLALWVDYLRSIYLADALANPGQVTAPLSGLTWKLRAVGTGLAESGLTMAAMASATAVLGFLVQGAWILRELAGSGWRSAWALVGASYLLLGLTIHQVVWEGTPGAFTRVLLPLTIGTNVLLAARPRASWVIIVTANACAVPAAILFGRG